MRCRNCFRACERCWVPTHSSCPSLSLSSVIFSPRMLRELPCAIIEAYGILIYAHSEVVSVTRVIDRLPQPRSSGNREPTVALFRRLISVIGHFIGSLYSFGEQTRAGPHLRPLQRARRHHSAVGQSPQRETHRRHDVREVHRRYCRTRNRCAEIMLGFQARSMPSGMPPRSSSTLSRTMPVGD